MSVFRDALGNLIDTAGMSQPVSAAGNPAPSAQADTADNPNGTPVADFKYIDPTTFAVITSRG